MQRIGFVVFPDFQVMGFAALTAFEIANVISGQAYYRIQLLSEHGGPIRASAGFTVETTAIGRKSFDTVGHRRRHEKPYPASAGILDFVRRSVRTARRVAAPCIGAFTLAEAGVLDGRRATTHWAFARELQSRFPQLKVEEDRIFIIDGPVWTSAGMSAGIDLALAMVGERPGSGDRA